MGKITSKYVLYFALRSQDNIVSTVTTLWARQSRVQITVEASDFFFSITSRPNLGPSQPTIQCVLGVLFWQ